MKLTDQQKKWAWIVGAVLVAIHFAPGFLAQFSHLRAPAPAVVQKASPAHVAPVQAPTPPPSPEVVAATRYAGIWAGDALMPDQNRCGIRVEIRLSDDLPKKLKGYESKKCIPLQPFAGGKLSKGPIGKVIEETSPVSAVLTATPNAGGLIFTVDQTIGTPYDGCTLTGMTLIDFGQGQVQVQWQSRSSSDAPCPDNRMLLKKARN